MSLYTQTTATAVNEVLTGGNSLYGAAQNSANTFKEVTAQAPDQTGLALGVLQTTQNFAAIMAQGLESDSALRMAVDKAGGALSLVSLMNNIFTAYDDMNKPGSNGLPTDGTLAGIAGDLSALLVFLGAAGASPILFTAGLTAAIGLGIFALSRTDGTTVIADYYQNLFSTGQAVTNTIGAQNLLEQLKRLGNGDASSGLNQLLYLQASPLLRDIGLGGRLRGLIPTTSPLLATIQSKLATASTTPSPILLDLDGDGVETTAVKAGAYFDHANDGFAEQTGWVWSDDALLVRDLDGNGLIDSGAELFGSETRLANGGKAGNGFAALAELDQNHDGKVDGNDAAFSTLKVWQDTDGDGYSANGELLSLAEAGVQSLHTGYANSTQVDAHGNAHKQVGSYTTTTGQTHTATDVWFATDPAYSLATDWVDVPEAIALLPDATGYGKVYDLHQAMARDTSGQLQSLVSQFIQATTGTQRDGLLNPIIYQWAGVAHLDPSSRGGMIGDARLLYALEAFTGAAFRQNGSPIPQQDASAMLRSAYADLAELVNGQLMAQSHLKPLFDTIEYAWDKASQTPMSDLDKTTAITTVFQTNRLAFARNDSSWERMA